MALQRRCALPDNFVLPFLAANGLTAEGVEAGRAHLHGVEGALTWSDVEFLVSAGDPVAWAYLNLREPRDIRDENGTLFRRKGDPWQLFPIQAKLARLRGDIIAMCGAEVGKTRDIVLQILWALSTTPGAPSVGVIAWKDAVLDAIWSELKYQVGENPAICGGLVDKDEKPLKKGAFRNGAAVEMRLCGFDGTGVRGMHVTRMLLIDEAAAMKKRAMFTEAWSRSMPGCERRVYGTPDGDYSGPYHSLCARADSVDGRMEKDEILIDDFDSPKFKIINIRKYDLPEPFWSAARARKFEELYGGRDTLDWQNNIEGTWGSPEYSVFPAEHLDNMTRKYLPDFRMVRATIDRKAQRVFFAAARLDPGVDEVDNGGNRRNERLLASEDLPYSTGRELAQRIAGFVPGISRADEQIFIGADLGFEKDPTEIVAFRKIGPVLSQIFRLHLRYAKGPEQEEIFRALDCALGHVAIAGLDAGSAGSFLVATLANNDGVCPRCGKFVYLSERVHGFNFGAKNDLLDLETGEPVPNPDRSDESGTPLAMRFSNKEASTRYIETLMHRGFIQIANDGGAGNMDLSGPRLLSNHTSKGVSTLGERQFKDRDDHYPDALRQLMLAVMYAHRGTPMISVTKDNWSSADARPSAGFTLDDVRGFGSIPPEAGRIFDFGRQPMRMFQ